ncbi:hypothetical protein BKA62DRAFT_758769 [Auriculariales sp. MPI-PUGE-AT-0066]|nr:hypothetical protein BKA62DRAFT_758769 [Auriculariales sp. MPI-PUGE-AT-0066]
MTDPSPSKRCGKEAFQKREQEATTPSFCAYAPVHLALLSISDAQSATKNSTRLTQAVRSLQVRTGDATARPDILMSMAHFLHASEQLRHIAFELAEADLDDPVLQDVTFASARGVKAVTPRPPTIVTGLRTLRRIDGTIALRTRGRVVDQTLHFRADGNHTPTRLGIDLTVAALHILLTHPQATFHLTTLIVRCVARTAWLACFGATSVPEDALSPALVEALVQVLAEDHPKIVDVCRDRRIELLVRW